MTIDLWPTTDEFLQVFSEQVALAGGRVTDAFHDADGGRLFARAILPTPRDVSPGDKLQGGVALRAADHDVRVHPYTFRQVCSNGAIMAHAVDSRVIDCGNPFEVLNEVRETVQLCCTAEVFASSVADMAATRDQDASLLLTLLPSLARLPSDQASRIFGQIFDRYRRDRDRSAFGLMQAVTATARDTRDPETRWRIEALGGSVPALLHLAQRSARDAKAGSRQAEAMLTA